MSDWPTEENYGEGVDVTHSDQTQDTRFNTATHSFHQVSPYDVDYNQVNVSEGNRLQVQSWFDSEPIAECQDSYGRTYEATPDPTDVFFKIIIEDDSNQDEEFSAWKPDRNDIDFGDTYEDSFDVLDVSAGIVLQYGPAFISVAVGDSGDYILTDELSSLEWGIDLRDTSYRFPLSQDDAYGVKTNIDSARSSGNSFWLQTKSNFSYRYLCTDGNYIYVDTPTNSYSTLHEMKDP